jgi:hypothetical protein
MRALIAVTAALAVLAPLYITVSAAELTCRVPFEFAVNGTAMPAGSYAIATAGGGNALMLRHFRKSTVVVTVLDDSRGDLAGQARLVFLKGGDRYTLIEVRTADGMSRAIPGARHAVEDWARSATLPVEQIVVPAS